MGFFEATHGWGGKPKSPLPTQNPLYKSRDGETWRTYTLTKEDPKKDINHTDP